MNLEEIKLMKGQFRELGEEIKISPLELDLGDKLATFDLDNIKRQKIIKKKYTILGESLRINEYMSKKVIPISPVKKIYNSDDERIVEKVEQLIVQKIKSEMREYGLGEEYKESFRNLLYDDGRFLEETFRYASNIVNMNKRENKERSCRRSRQTVLDLAFCNPQLKFFLTLTFKDEEFTNYDKAYSEFRKFRDRLQKWYKRNYDEKLEFLATFETTKKGRWHIHILTNFDYKYFFPKKIETWYINWKKRIKSEDKKELENYINNKFWGNGFIDYQEMYDSTGSAFYLSKYMLKETEECLVEESGTRYKCSRGLNRPLVFYIEDTEKGVEMEKNLELYVQGFGDIEKYSCINKSYLDYNSLDIKGQEKVINETFYVKKVDKKVF